MSSQSEMASGSKSATEPQEIIERGIRVIEHWDLEWPLADVIAFFQEVVAELKERGYTNPKLVYDFNQHSYSVAAWRRETPLEVERRLKEVAEEQERQQQETAERELYLKLKKKYGDYGDYEY